MNEDEYNVEILRIGKWSLNRRPGEANTFYHAMIFHECPPTGTEPNYQNGEYKQECRRCKDRIPDEIWGLWHLLCNDQRMGFNK